MSNIKTICILLIGAFILSGCYHAKITTDKEPSNKTIEKPWAHSFVFGLVPPSTVETAEKCPNGVAIVETKISFLNGLVASLTGNLYTPMTIKVTCAQGGMSSVQEMPKQSVSAEADYFTKSLMLEKAATASSLSGQPVRLTLK